MGNANINKTYIIEACDLSGSTTGSTVSFGPVIFAFDYVSSSLTYVGYGTTIECKILKVETLSGGTYTSFWSNGEETLDKIWVDRLSYSYF